MAHVAGARLPTAQDFDFFMGRWTVQNRRLTERLAGSDEWEEFESTSVAHPILGGLGNEDEFRTRHAGGFIGMSFRFFDPVKRCPRPSVGCNGGGNGEGSRCLRGRPRRTTAP